MSYNPAIEKYKSLLVGLDAESDLIKNLIEIILKKKSKEKNIVVVEIISFNFFENSKGLLLK
tara:strand:+ start:1843 stop:2028 length:186 start_codon:yes stop_codon:yes gene_type:complete